MSRRFFLSRAARRLTALRSLITAACLSALWLQTGFGVPAAADDSAASSSESADHLATVGNAEKKVVLISERGFDPPVMELETLDGSVFFVNSTKDSLITLNVDFGGKHTHCASGNMELSPSHSLVSKSPIAPRDFALMCFPDRGKYTARAYGVKGKKDPIVGTVVVE